MSRIQTLNSATLQIDAPAKLNLGLRVFPPRPDGFHDLESWFVPLAWHDTLTVTASETLEFSVTGRTRDIPTEHHKNLITRAAMLLAAHAKIPPRAHIHLHKVLPPGGGLGGGSSDAASALLALDHLWKLGLSSQALTELAAELGSDVPFFIGAAPALCRGRGEIMSALPPRHNLFAVLIIPPQGCPTKDVFQAFDRMLPEAPQPKIDWQKLSTLPADQLNHVLINDLAPPAYKIAPWLGELQQRAASIAHQPVHLTGSGSTLFTLASSSMGAAQLQSLLTTALDKSVTTIATQVRSEA